jgi:hypothetical protein
MYFKFDLSEAIVRSVQQLAIDVPARFRFRFMVFHVEHSGKMAVIQWPVEAKSSAVCFNVPRGTSISNAMRGELGGLCLVNSCGHSRGKLFKWADVPPGSCQCEGQVLRPWSFTTGKVDIYFHCFFKIEIKLLHVAQLIRIAGACLLLDYAWLLVIELLIERDALVYHSSILLRLGYRF